MFCRSISPKWNGTFTARASTSFTPETSYSIAARATAILRGRHWRPEPATVVSIEISPSSAECIRRNTAAEIAAGRVIVYPKGVWDKEDMMMLNVDDTNFAANSVVMRPNPLIRAWKYP